MFLIFFAVLARALIYMASFGAAGWRDGAAWNPQLRKESDIQIIITALKTQAWA